MKNPYFIDEPAGISFSGGRSSAYMLYKILVAHGGVLPDYVKVVFANTGKEMPQSLDFVKACSDRWGVDIAWVELSGAERIEEDGKRVVLKKDFKIVGYETASRKGGPFDIFLNASKSIPNAASRSCTGALKLRAIAWYIETVCGIERPHLQLIGIRGDEQRRAKKIHGTYEDGQDRFCPLWLDGVTAREVGDFWRGQEFDLMLPNNNGVTDWGNCDLCFLKGKSKRASIIREHPSLANWWIDVEDIMEQQFRPDEPSYSQMKQIALDQFNIFNGIDDDSISCFCGD